MLCSECKQPYTAGTADCNTMGIPIDTPPTLYRAAGCSACNQLGYRGRSGIYELVGIDDDMRTMIHDGSGEHELDRHARQFAPGIRQDGWSKVLRGITSIEEVLRVTQGD
jgi:general secretion pathway protein E